MCDRSLAETGDGAREGSPSGRVHVRFGSWEQFFYGEFDCRQKKRVLVKSTGE